MHRSGVRDTLVTLEELVRSTSAVSGHAALVFVSEGFASSIGSTHSLLAAAQQKHVTIYFLNARGLRVSGRSGHASVPGIGVVTGYANGMARENRPEPHDLDASLGAQELATATGGFSIQNTENLIGGLERVARQTRTYYVLGYQPRNAVPDGKFRQIEVRLRPKGLSAQARRGYYSVAPEATAGRAAAPSPFDSSPEIPLRLTAFVQRPADDNRARVRLVAEVDPSAIRFQETEGTLAASLESSTRLTPRGRPPEEPQAHRADIRLSPEQLAEVRATWLPLTRDLSLAPGVYQARIQVTEPATGRLGSVEHSFEVPDPSGFRVTTPILSEQLRPNGEVVEVAHRDFAPGSRLLCEFEVVGARNGSTAQVTAGFRLMATDGTVMARSEPSPIALTSDGRLPRRFAVNLKTLPAGEYSIELTVRDDLAGRELTQHEPFVVATTAPPAAAQLPGDLPPQAAGASDENPATYLDLLDRYRERDPKQAVQTLLDWPRDRLVASLRGIKDGHIACGSRCLRSALLLGLEASIAERRSGNDEEADFHLSQAGGLAHRLEYPDRGFRRDWLLASGLALRMEGKARAPIELFSQCAQAAKMMDPRSGREVGVEGDVACQLALATTYEELATVALPDAGPLAKLPSAPRFQRGVETKLRAQNAYERVLRLAPEWEEAHLRFGRYLQRVGDTKGAHRELSLVLDRSQVAPHRALAHLFMGRLAEAREQFEDAALHYRAALEEQPTCQAARLALGHTLLRSGRPQEAIAAARGALTAPDDPEAIESWLAYRSNVVFEFERRMASLKESLRP